MGQWPHGLHSKCSHRASQLGCKALLVRLPIRFSCVQLARMPTLASSSSLGRPGPGWGNRYRKLLRFTTKLWSLHFLQNLKSAWFWTCLTLQSRNIWQLHCGHWLCDWCSAATIWYWFEQSSLPQSAHFLGLTGQMMASVDTGISKSLNFVCWLILIQANSSAMSCLPWEESVQDPETPNPVMPT